MKPFVLLALLVLAGNRLALGQTSSSLSLDVTPVSAGAAVQNTVTTRTGPATVTSARSNVHVTTAKEALQINLRNLGALPSNAQVEWYFVAAPVHPLPEKPADEQEFIFDRGNQAVTVAGGAAQTIHAESQEVTSTKKASASRSSRTSTSTTKKPAETGSALRGWLVRVTVDGKTAAAKGSTDTYQEIAEDDTSLQALLAGAPPKEARSKRKKKS